jgi:aromatic ring-opening dioxygenase catalytic subunit (LigB family)
MPRTAQARTKGNIVQENHMSTTTMPTFFIPHGGGPCFFMDWSVMGRPKDEWKATEAWLRALLPALKEKPKAIVLISGHWEEAVFTASAMAQPDMIFDYYNFPPHTYELDYPAPGAPDLARRIVELLQQAGLPATTTDTRGFDHGVFVPMLLIDPAAQIPVVTLSLKSDLDPAEHRRAGEALAALRDEGVLLIGSGMSFHNMQAFFHPTATQPSAVFDQWLTGAIEATPRERADALDHWATAPAGRLSHPREEHLLPLMVVAGAAAQDRGAQVFTDNVMYADISGYRFG